MKRLDQLTQLTASQLSPDDIIGIRDQSAGVTKYITVRDLTGLPELGFTSTGETWTYSSFSSTTRLGVITVPSDATTKYSKGMWVRFAQTTGGTKYGVIMSVTATSLTVNMLGYTLNNEALTTPVYSTVKQPFGAPALPYEFTDANGWRVKDYGTYQEYMRRDAFNASVPASNVVLLATVSMPIGVTNHLSLQWQSAQIAGYIGRITYQFDNNNTSGQTSMPLYLYNNTGGSIPVQGHGFLTGSTLTGA